MTAKLYCFGESGNAYKAALTMTLAGYPFETVYVDFFNGEARSPEFLALNVMGEVPVLVEGDMTLSQSGAIQLHVAQATGRLMGKPEDHSEIMRWLFWDNHKGSSQFGPLRLYWPDPASFDWRAGVLALLAFVLAFGAKWSVLRLLAVCAAGGLALSLAG